MKSLFLKLFALNLLCFSSFSAAWYLDSSPPVLSVHRKVIDSTQKHMGDIVDAFAMENLEDFNGLLQSDPLPTPFPKQSALYMGNILRVSADEQTKGEGNESRSWQSPKGGIYATFLFPWPLFEWPKDKEKETIRTFFQEIAGISVIEVLESYGMAPQLKWPNDVLVDDKKICGILCKDLNEISFLEGRRTPAATSSPHRAWIVGIGLNVNMDLAIKEEMEQKPASKQDDMGLPFTSMQLELDHPFTDKEMQTVMDLLTQQLIKNYQRLINEKDSVMKVFLPFIDKHLAYVGKTVKYKLDEDAEPEKDLTMVGVDIWGRLLLKPKEGQNLTKGGGRIFPQSLRK